MCAERFRNESNSATGAQEPRAEIDILNPRPLVEPTNGPESTSTDCAETGPECTRLALAVLMDPVVSQICVECRATRDTGILIVGTECGQYSPVACELRQENLKRVTGDERVGIHNHRDLTSSLHSGGISALGRTNRLTGMRKYTYRRQTCVLLDAVG